MGYYSFMSLRNIAITAAVLALCVASGSAVPAAQRGDARPEIVLRVTPPMGVAPLRIVITAELVGGADDYADYYCPRVEWDWADGSRSEAVDDCAPYEPGKSEIRRRFSQQRTFRQPGDYQIRFQLKQGTRVVGGASIKLEVRGG
jgi:hypothetical protein